MPELDAEHRDKLVETLFLARQRNASPADALAPLVAGWLADAWDAGHDVCCDVAREFHDPEVDAPNPYRGGDDG